MLGQDILRFIPLVLGNGEKIQNKRQKNGRKSEFVGKQKMKRKRLEWQRAKLYTIH